MTAKRRWRSTRRGARRWLGSLALAAWSLPSGCILGHATLPSDASKAPPQDAATTTADAGPFTPPDAGGTWTVETSPVAYPGTVLNRIWGSGPGDVWAIGAYVRSGCDVSSGLVAHTAGDGTWSMAPTVGGGGADGDDVWGSGPGDVYFASASSNVSDIDHMAGWGGTFTRQSVPATGEVMSIFGTSATDVYAVDFAGQVLHSPGAGAAWTVRASSVPCGSSGCGSLWHVWASGPSDIYVVGSNGFGPFVAHSADGTSFTAQKISGGTILYDLWGSGPSDLYAVGDGGVFHSTGDGTWTAQPTGLTATLAGVWGSGPRDVYAVGGSSSSCVILHSSGGGAWSSETCPAPMVSGYRPLLVGIWGSAWNDVYAVGTPNLILHLKR